MMMNNVTSHAPTSEQKNIPIWPWLILICLLTLIIMLLKFGADDSQTPSQTEDARFQPNTSQEATTMADSPTSFSVKASDNLGSSTQITNENPMLKTQALTLPNEQLVKPGDDSAFLNDGDTETEDTEEDTEK
ncbi:hypothetical protein [Agitococcus lubricus]|uniref:Uncharacterized protein n=1 Tax=Agitococcus lubricus TaxID=1077255 RepID=A0A2T5IUA1_9GAMM|nr:hypothetical protein [Agitococcus lubricus]PTQ87388.1 hypothetical protein C8N29_11935 [Agitococcus lubricus]